jgi:hypothetical protein
MVLQAMLILDILFLKGVSSSISLNITSCFCCDL